MQANADKDGASCHAACISAGKTYSLSSFMSVFLEGKELSCANPWRSNCPGLQDPPAVVLVSNVIRGLALLRIRCQDVSHVLMRQVVRLSTPVRVCAVTGPKDPELGACGIRARTA